MKNYNEGNVRMWIVRKYLYIVTCTYAPLKKELYYSTLMQCIHILHNGRYIRATCSIKRFS